MLGLGVGLRLAAVVGLCLAVLSTAPFRGATGTQAVAVEHSPPRMALPVMPRDMMAVASVSMDVDGRPWIATVVTPPRRPARLDPQSLCDLMAGDAGAMTWSESAVFPGEWECFTGSGGTPESPDSAGEDPIFAMARGRNEATIDFVRLKLSLRGDDTAPDDAKRLQDIADALMDAAGRSLPDPIREALEALQPGRVAAEGLDIVFAPEIMFPGRYNLIIRFRPREAG